MVELKELVAIMGDQETNVAVSNNTRNAPQNTLLTADEVTILQGVLTIREKRITDIITPLSKVFMLPEDTVLDSETLTQVQNITRNPDATSPSDQILHHGHSRVPVYRGTDRTSIQGMLLVKHLLLLTLRRPAPDAVPIPLTAVPCVRLPRVPVSAGLLDVLNVFQRGASHMALVTDASPDAPRVVGIVTLEDVLEAVIQEEILDEFDTALRPPPSDDTHGPDGHDTRGDHRHEADAHGDDTDDDAPLLARPKEGPSTQRRPPPRRAFSARTHVHADFLALLHRLSDTTVPPADPADPFHASATG